MTVRRVARSRARGLAGSSPPRLAISATIAVARAASARAQVGRAAVARVAPRGVARVDLVDLVGPVGLVGPAELEMSAVVGRVRLGTVRAVRARKAQAVQAVQAAQAAAHAPVATGLSRQLVRRVIPTPLVVSASRWALTPMAWDPMGSPGIRSASASATKSGPLGGPRRP